jgi:glycosyltransferase involved in cell wall biosynthesis
LKVLLISDAYPPVFGGATRAAQQLSRQLRLRGHQVAVATAWQRGLPALENDAGVEVYRMRGLVSRMPALSSDPVRYTPPPFPDPELVWRIARLIRSFEPDLVHSYGWLTYSCLPAMWRTQVPLMLAAREYANVCAVRTLVRHGRERGRACSGPAWPKCLDCAGSFYGQPKGAVAVASVLGQRRVLRRRTDALHSVSRFCEQILRRYLIRGSDMPMKVLPDFREDELEGPSDPAILARLPREPFILFVGSFRRIKGDQLLLDAYAELRDPPPLVMVGARSAEPLPNFPPGVVPLTDVPHGTVMAIWDRALFGVCPSIAPEALGNTVHEGMSRGKAVIGISPSGHDDMIESQRTGILVPPADVNALGDALRRLVSDPDLCRRMGEAAREDAQRFAAQTVVPELVAFLEAAVARGRVTRTV